MFESLGFRPGRLFATAAALGEIVSGLLLAAGLLGPVGPALMLSVMIVAAVSVHWQHGLFAASNGVELPLLYAAIAVLFGAQRSRRLLGRHAPRAGRRCGPRPSPASRSRPAWSAHWSTWRFDGCRRRPRPDATGPPEAFGWNAAQAQDGSSRGTHYGCQADRGTRLPVPVAGADVALVRVIRRLIARTGRSGNSAW